MSVKLLLEIADPRGRCNRTGFLVIALAMAGAQIAAAGAFVAAGASPHGPLGLAFNALFLWLATAAVSKRLHDVGLSAWWMLKGAGLILAWAVVFTSGLMVVLERDAFEPGGAGFLLAVSATTLPVLLAVLWLHFVHGEPGVNAFGPEPDNGGFSRAQRACRAYRATLPDAA